MSSAQVLHIGSQALLLAVKLSAPLLIVSLVIGVVVSLVQSVTQVQEMTLTFVPKLVGVAVVLVFAGGWMLQQTAAFTQQLFESIPRLLGV